MKPSSSRPLSPAARRPANGGGAEGQKSRRKLPEPFFEPLDEQEKALQEADEKGEFRLVPDQEGWRTSLRDAARRTLAKDKHISIRLATADVLALKEKAADLGIPYQTLIGSLLHQYVEGKIRASL
jgi:predicted DNA binding CopG/RHH family protein